jgi:hypothetical protein
MAKQRRLVGRDSIFRGKDGGLQVHGIITRTGGQRFERARRQLEALFYEVIGRPPTGVSDADVIEYLARGRDETERYLEHERPT